MIRGIPPVPMSVEEWTTLLAAVGPRGKAWGDPGSRMWSFWRGLAPEFQRIHALVLSLVTDLNPTTMTEPWIALWETILGLPEADLPVPSTVADRRAAVIARLGKTAWGQSRPFYVALAALLGLTVAIDLPGTAPSRWRVTCPEAVTVARFGTALAGDRFDVYSTAGSSLYRLFHRRKRLASRIMFRD